MKIFITGNSGCGKTTSANKIAEKYNIPVCSLDDFVWQDNVVPSVKREYSERKKLLDEFLKNESWVIEGMSHSEWMLDVYRLADLIFLYETSDFVCKYRIIKRSIKKRLGLQKGYTENWKHIKQLFNIREEYKQKTIPEIKRNTLCLNKLYCVKKHNQIIKLCDNFNCKS